MSMATVRANTAQLFEIMHRRYAQIARRANLPQASALVARGRNTSPFLPSRAHLEGRIAIVTDVGCGMRWTRVALKTNAPVADGKVVWCQCRRF
jgi:hypothetical protein